MNSRQTECAAYSGPGGKGVYAVARCCVTGGLQCEVQASPELGKDAECVDPRHHLTGESHSAVVQLPFQLCCVKFKTLHAT